MTDTVGVDKPAYGNSSGWRPMTVLAGSFGIVSIALSVMNVAFDALVVEFDDTSVATLSWVLNGYTTVTAALLIAAGRIADAYGRRRIFLLGLAVYVIASVAGAVAPSAAWLIAARVGQGVGGALVTPTSLALLLSSYPADRRSTVIGIWGSVGAVAAAGGPALGGLIVDTLGWRWVFWFSVPLSALAWVGAKRWLEETPTENAGGAPDPSGIALSAGAVGFLALGLAQSGDWGWGDQRTIAALVAGPVLSMALVARSRLHPRPVLDLALFKVRSFVVGNLTLLLFNAAFSAMILNNILFLSRVWGYSQAAAGFGITPSPLSAAVMAQLSGRAADRYGTRAMIVPGIVLFLVGVSLLTFGIGAEPQYWTRWFPAALCFGTGVGMVFTNASSAAVSDAPPHRYAIASASNATARAIGSVLGPAFVLGTIGSRSGPDAIGRFDQVWVVTLVVGLISLVLAVQLPGRARELTSMKV